MMLTKSEVLTERVVTKAQLVKTRLDQKSWSQSIAHLFSLFTSLFDQNLGQKAFLNQVLCCKNSGANYKNTRRLHTADHPRTA
jgi:hypothetical protein